MTDVRPVEVALDVALTHRLTRLVTTDRLTHPLREKAIERAYANTSRWRRDNESWTDIAVLDDDAPLPAYLLMCRWCASVWVGAVVGVVRRRRLVAGVAYGLALSTASMALVEYLDD